MTYCTEQQAVAAGAFGSDEQIAAAIAAAQQRVDRFCGDIFEPDVDDRTMLAAVLASGTVRTPYVREITSVSVETFTTPIVLPDTAYRVAADHRLMVLAGYAAGSDALVAGAEPWNGGWGNLLGGSTPLDEVVVVGKFGWDEPPSEVAQATALIAAQIVPRAFTGEADDEGNPQAVAGIDPARQTAPRGDDFASQFAGGRPSRSRLDNSTGSAEADRLLAHLRVALRVA